MDNKQQTAVEWYDNQLRKVFSNTTEASNFSHEELLQQAKEMEKERMNNMPIHIHEGISNTWVYIEDGVVHVKPNQP
jgi:hypothetical protein